jgi:hypothetical protein
MQFATSTSSKFPLDAGPKRTADQRDRIRQPVIVMLRVS